MVVMTPLNYIIEPALKSRKKYQWIVGKSLNCSTIRNTTFSAFLCDSKNWEYFWNMYQYFVFKLRSPMCWKRYYFFAIWDKILQLEPWGIFSKSDAKILEYKHFSVSFLRSVLSWVKLSMTLYQVGWPEKYCSVLRTPAQFSTKNHQVNAQSSSFMYQL